MPATAHLVALAGLLFSGPDPSADPARTEQRHRTLLAGSAALTGVGASLLGTGAATLQLDQSIGAVTLGTGIAAVALGVTGLSIIGTRRARLRSTELDWRGYATPLERTRLRRHRGLVASGTSTIVLSSLIWIPWIYESAWGRDCQARQTRGESCPEGEASGSFAVSMSGVAVTGAALLTTAGFGIAALVSRRNSHQREKTIEVFPSGAGISGRF